MDGLVSDSSVLACVWMGLGARDRTVPTFTPGTRAEGGVVLSLTPDTMVGGGGMDTGPIFTPADMTAEVGVGRE